MAEFPSPYEFVKHAFETVQYDGKLLSEWVEEINKHTWISVEERLPPDFVSVLAHMTDAGEFPSVREAYAVCGGVNFFFPALRELHPVDYWMEMPLPKPPKEELKP